MNSLPKEYRSNMVCGPLSREEKVQIICSVLSGMGSKVQFCDAMVKARMQQCLQIAEELI